MPDNGGRNIGIRLAFLQRIEAIIQDVLISKEVGKIVDGSNTAMETRLISNNMGTSMSPIKVLFLSGRQDTLP